VQRGEEIDLRADVEMQRGLIEKQEQRLLRKSASEDDALLFSAGDFAHPAIAEMIGANLSQGVAAMMTSFSLSKRKERP